jgi:hypothetical protein
MIERCFNCDAAAAEIEQLRAQDDSAVAQLDRALARAEEAEAERNRLRALLAELRAFLEDGAARWSRQTPVRPEGNPAPGAVIGLDPLGYNPFRHTLGTLELLQGRGTTR